MEEVMAFELNLQELMSCYQMEISFYCTNISCIVLYAVDFSFKNKFAIPRVQSSFASFCSILNVPS